MSLDPYGDSPPIPTTYWRPRESESPQYTEKKRGAGSLALWQTSDLPLDAIVTHVTLIAYRGERPVVAWKAGQISLPADDTHPGESLDDAINRIALEQAGAIDPKPTHLGHFRTRATSQSTTHAPDTITYEVLYAVEVGDLADFPSDTAYERRIILQRDLNTLLRSSYVEVRREYTDSLDHYLIDRLKANLSQAWGAAANEISLEGRKVLLTGASSILGRAFAFRFALAGAGLALTTATADAEEAFEVQRLGRSLATQGRQALTEALDLSSGANVQVAVRQIAKALGGLDTAIVISDLRQERATQRLGDAEWSKLLGANLGAAFFVARAVYREVAQREPDDVGVRGRIIVVQREPSEHDGSVYKATKIGALALVQALREEWQEDGVAVSLLSVPGSEEERLVAKATETILALLDAPFSASGVHRVEL